MLIDEEKDLTSLKPIFICVNHVTISPEVRAVRMIVCISEYIKCIQRSVTTELGRAPLAAIYFIDEVDGRNSATWEHGRHE